MPSEVGLHPIEIIGLVQIHIGVFALVLVLLISGLFHFPDEFNAFYMQCALLSVGVVETLIGLSNWFCTTTDIGPRWSFRVYVITLQIGWAVGLVLGLWWYLPDYINNTIQGFAEIEIYSWLDQIQIYFFAAAAALIAFSMIALSITDIILLSMKLIQRKNQ